MAEPKPDWMHELADTFEEMWELLKDLFAEFREMFNSWAVDLFDAIDECWTALKHAMIGGEDPIFNAARGWGQAEGASEDGQALPSQTLLDVAAALGHEEDESAYASLVNIWTGASWDAARTMQLGIIHSLVGGEFHPGESGKRPSAGDVTEWGEFARFMFMSDALHRFAEAIENSVLDWGSEALSIIGVTLAGASLLTLSSKLGAIVAVLGAFVALASAIAWAIGELAQQWENQSAIIGGVDHGLDSIEPNFGPEWAKRV